MGVETFEGLRPVLCPPRDSPSRGVAASPPGRGGEASAPPLGSGGDPERLGAGL